MPLISTVGITILITIHTRRHENPIFLSREVEAELLRIIRIKARGAVSSATGAKLVRAGRGDAGGSRCAFVEEGVRVAGLWAGGRAFEVAGAVAIGRGCAVQGTLVALVSVSSSSKLNFRFLTYLFSRIFVAIPTLGWAAIARLAVC